MEALNVDQIKKTRVLIDNLLEKMRSNLITVEEYQLLQKMLIEYIVVGQVIIEQCPRFSWHSIKEYPLCKTSIDGEKHLYIADTHIGYKYETPGLMIDVCSFGIGQGVDYIIHTGDLTEGTCRDFDRKPEELESEIERALSLLPTEVKTKLLIGNHDYSAFLRYPPLISMYFSKDNIDILGMGQVLLDWDNYLMSINHKIKRVSFEKNREDTAVNINGHYHNYQISEDKKSILLPTLSNDDSTVPLYENFGLKFESKPTFVISEKTSLDTVLFKCYNEKMEIFEETESNTKTGQLVRIYKH